MWRAYVWEKMTLQELSIRFEMSIPVVRSLLARHQENTTPPYTLMTPQSVYLVIDAFYRSRGDGTIVFRSVTHHKNLLWRDIKYETIADYVSGVQELISAGWIILGITIDGRKGTLEALSKYAPAQHCQFHQLQTVTKYLTKRPKLEPHIALKRVSSILIKTDESTFTRLLERWFIRYGDLVKERTYHPGGGWSYTHGNLRSCYLSLKRNNPHLFTYLDYPGMPNTTNTLDGSISHLRTLHRIHRGMNLRLRRKVTEELLRGKSTK